jgi:hypothetical protein
MSWEIFKQNILRVANSPEGISDIGVVAELYAKEYDAAVKRGFDTQHKIPLVSGNVEMMKQLFASALQKGVNSSTPYDLVGEMGAGVKAYWAGAVMATSPLPIQPAIQATVNLSVTQNIVTDPGIWQKPISGPSVISEELTPEQRIEYQESLEEAIEKYIEFTAQNELLKAQTISDIINKYTAILDKNKDYNTEVPIQNAILGIVPGQPITTNVPVPATPATPTTTTTKVEPKVDLGYFELDSSQPLTSTPSTPSSTEKAAVPEIISAEKSNIIDTKEKVDLGYFELDSGQSINISVSDDEFGEIKFNQGKPFVSGFKIGGGGAGGGAPYVKFNNFAGDATIGGRAVQIAVYDAGQDVIENPDDTGHPRILQIQTLGGAKIGGGTGWAWCGATVGTWWTEAEGKNSLNESSILKTHPNPAYVPAWVDWAIKNGRYVDMKNPENAKFVPKAGDGIIYDWDGTNGASNHIGMFWKIDGGKWWGIDGNKGPKGRARITAHCIKDMGAVQGVIIWQQ